MTKHTTDEAAVDDAPCTDCGGTGVTIQTERRCACQPPAGNEGDTLESLIEARLIGVPVDDQDLALEDDDWRLIVAALRQTKEAADEIETLRARLTGAEQNINIKADFIERTINDMAGMDDRLKQAERMLAEAGADIEEALRVLRNPAGSALQTVSSAILSLAHALAVIRSAASGEQGA